MTPQSESPRPEGVKVRISDEQLAKLAHDIAGEPKFAAYVGPRVVIACILDLADARSEMARLKALSASQAEALDMMDRGVKL